LPRKILTSIDNAPWLHPFLNKKQIAEFRSYSEKVWEFAHEHSTKSTEPLDIAFANNMAQNMFKWANMVKMAGNEVTLYLNPQDNTAISRPEWEEYNGEFAELMNASAFLEQCDFEQPEVAFIVAPNEGSRLWEAYHDALEYHSRATKLRNALLKISSILADLIFPTIRKNRKPDQIARLKLESPGIRHEELLSYDGHYPYYEWAVQLAKHDVIYIASTPFPAYASGQPYCVFAVGGDVQIDCGRADAGGRAMLKSFAQARFLFISNPHVLGHCRRLGLTNGVYLPYPMDTEKYCPGIGEARLKWQKQYGGDCYILVTARIDSGVKGYGVDFLDQAEQIIKQRPSVRFILLGWGSDIQILREGISLRSLNQQILILPTVGKIKLIDYYRSCDIVLDQMVYGYYGATALEAAACGKPVVMKLRSGHYEPLYYGDVAPITQVEGMKDISTVLIDLIDNPDQVVTKGHAMREWLVRNHGQEKTTKLLVSLLRIAADGVPLPEDLHNPLEDVLSIRESIYHMRCKTKAEKN
jgi:glycosyltransferase involved in cell wall biosynthesis